MTRQKYQVYVALSEDINAPYVWVSNPLMQQRPIVNMTNHNTCLSFAK